MLAVAAVQKQAILGALVCTVYGASRGGAILAGAVWKDRRELRGIGEPAGGGIKAAMEVPLLAVSVAAVILVTIAIQT
jgi:hypothetical protein